MHPRIKDIVNLILLITYCIICLLRNIHIVLIALTSKAGYTLDEVLLRRKKCLKHLTRVGAVIFKELSLGNPFI
jgi:hypothetical protein